MVEVKNLYSKNYLPYPRSQLNSFGGVLRQDAHAPIIENANELMENIEVLKKGMWVLEKKDRFDLLVAYFMTKERDKGEVDGDGEPTVSSDGKPNDDLRDLFNLIDTIVYGGKRNKRRTQKRNGNKRRNNSRKQKRNNRSKKQNRR